MSALPALAPERDALWSSLESTSFLTTDEKRALAGFSPLPPSQKFNPFHDAIGRFTNADGQGQGSANVSLVSDRKRTIDLSEEEARGGHTIARHVGKSESFLRNRVETEVYRVGMFTVGLEQAGSFTSLVAANKLVNSVLADNAELVDKVASGELGGAKIDKELGAPTGYEMYKSSDKAQPYMRDTNTVRVVILHDPKSPTGFNVYTAFPRRSN